MSKFIKPNFDNSILNVSTTIAEFLGCKNLENVKRVKILEKYLSKQYKNVVYINLDGLGMFPLETNLGKDKFFYKNIKKKITSVFPSTTTNATTVLRCATYPSRHVMFGWSIYFKELDRAVAVYLGKDEYTGEPVDMSKIEDIIKISPYTDATSTDYQINSVSPPFITLKEGNNFHYNSNDEMFEQLSKICKRKGKQFIYCYNEEPDATMHKFGVTSNRAKEIINYFNDRIESFVKNNADTLVIITPDHGQTDIDEYIEIYKDKPLFETLKTPIYLEPRAFAFQIKEGQEERFLQEMKKYKKDIKLFKSSWLIEKDYFGEYTEKLKYLGDYIGVVKNCHKMILFGEKSVRFKGHHTGLTKREMILPLIIVGNKEQVNANN